MEKIKNLSPCKASFWCSFDFYSSSVWKEKSFKKEIYLDDFINFVKNEPIIYKERWTT